MVVVRASSLPKMDIFRKCDPYVVLWVDHGPHQATPFLTDVKYAEDNPVFNESFTWEYNHSTGKLCASLWDRDRITADDLIGCVYIDIPELAPNEWRELELPLLNPAIEKKIRASTVTLRLRKVPDHNRKLDKDSPGETEGDGPVNGADDVAEDEDLTSCLEPRTPSKASCFIASRHVELQSPNGALLSPKSTLPSPPQIASAASARRIATIPGRGQLAGTEAIQISARVPLITSNLGFAGFESVMQSVTEPGVEEASGSTVLANVALVSTLLKRPASAAVDSRACEDSSTFHC